MSYSFKKSKNKGFTLIEILLASSLMLILFTIAAIIINPKTQFQRANDAQRRSDVALILNAIGAYTSDNRGTLPSAITTTEAIITDSSGGANLCSLLVPKHTSALPTDPSLKTPDITACSSYNTGYTVVKDANDRVTVTAPSQESGTPISISR